MSRGLRAIVWIACGAIGMAVVAAEDAATDLDTGLVRTDGWQDVRSYCGSCHSLALVVSQRASRASWQQTLRSMRRLHNMVALPTRTEARIVDYLAEHYAIETSRQRRAPIRSGLMPRPRQTANSESEDGLRPVAATWQAQECDPVPGQP